MRLKFRRFLYESAASLIGERNRLSMEVTHAYQMVHIKCYVDGAFRVLLSPSIPGVQWHDDASPVIEVEHLAGKLWLSSWSNTSYSTLHAIPHPAGLDTTVTPHQQSRRVSFEGWRICSEPREQQAGGCIQTTWRTGC